jgi:signal transduction histidine kinase
MTQSGWRSWFRGFSSFRARVFWSVVPVVVSFLVFQGWMNVREHRRLVTREFEKRGLALASNLGFASELGAFSEDKQLLEAAMRGTLRNPDVSYVLIYSRNGRVLARGGQSETSGTPPGDAQGDRSAARQVEHGGQRFLEFVSPIVSERSQTPDEVLLGARVRPKGEEAREEVIGAATVGLSLAGVEAQVRSLATLWGGVTVAFLIVSAAVLYGFSLRITNPIKQLTQQAQKIAAGELQQQIAVRSRDEIGSLAAAFNHMTGSLRVSMNEKERALSELAELNRTLEDRIRQRTVELEERRVALERSLKELEEKSRQLAAASRHKSDFLANVSHELRTPMNAILGFNEMILDQVYGDVSDELRRPLTDIQQSGRHLLRLISDVLDLSKIEAGRMDLVLGEYSVLDTVTAVRASLASLAAEKGLEFVVSVSAEMPLAYGDGRRITQCLLNLAGNALKFTRLGRVEIAVDLLDGMLRFRVSDTGIGISREQIDKIFTEFQQADAAIAREFGGTGLGLSITRKFVEMHEGRVWAESEIGKGSTFFFSIPLRVKGPMTA